MSEELKELSVEERFEKLDRMAARLESEETGLEESFRLYEEGMKLLKELHDEISGYEKKMLLLTPDGSMEEFGNPGDPAL